LILGLIDIGKDQKKQQKHGFSVFAVIIGLITATVFFSYLDSQKYTYPPKDDSDYEDMAEFPRDILGAEDEDGYDEGFDADYDAGYETGDWNQDAENFIGGYEGAQEPTSGYEAADVDNVTITVPKDFIDETTQEKIDEIAQENGLASAVLNEDGSITCVMTKAQQQEIMDSIAQTIDQGMEQMVGSEELPNVTDVTANSDYTTFVVTTTNEKPDLNETYAITAFYTYGKMYAIFSGRNVENIHVDFVNDATGEFIGSADSNS
jgi:hypothetical protein